MAVAVAVAVAAAAVAACGSAATSAAAARGDTGACVAMRSEAGLARAGRPAGGSHGCFGPAAGALAAGSWNCAASSSLVGWRP